MKKLLLLLVTLPFFSCIEDTDVARTDGNLFEALVSSQWRVNFFENEGLDKTSDFSGISFNFLSSNQVEAYRGSQLLEAGSWSTSVDDGRVEFEILFSGNSILNKLSNNWYQTLLVDKRLWLREDDDDSKDLLYLVML